MTGGDELRVKGYSLPSGLCLTWELVLGFVSPGPGTTCEVNPQRGDREERGGFGRVGAGGW